jgi:hypothetical protein
MTDDSGGRPWFPLPSREEMQARHQEWLRRNPAERHIDDVKQYRDLLVKARDTLRRALTCLDEVLQRADFNTADFENDPWCGLISEAENVVLSDDMGAACRAVLGEDDQ